MNKVIISGGGTGGHVFPAIAIADAIRAQDAQAEILFVGAMGKIEMEKVPQAGYNIEGLNISGFQRRLTFKNVLFPIKLAGSLIRALFLIKKFNPDVAVGVGGYASGPTLKIANILGIPTVLQEQNSFAGVTNRILSGKAEKICVAYDGMERFFPANKIVFTGNPVRKNILDNGTESSMAKKALGLPESKKTVLIFGGSLGARTINDAVLHNARQIMEMTSDVSFIWQVGKMYFNEYKDCSLSVSPDIKIVPFIENMDLAYSAADIVVCRAGALTISELAILGKATILIPSPNVAEDHQTVNALSLVNRGAAILVKDVEAKDKLIEEISLLLSDQNKRQSLEKNILYFSRPDAAIKIAEEILKLCKARHA